MRNLVFKRNVRGFTLIEFSIVMIISGLVLVSGMDLYGIYMKGQKKTGTYERMDKFNNAISAFYSSQKRYPCPADPALPESNPLAGVENCIASTLVGFNSGGIWKVAGRDANNDSIPDNVLIGSIPYKTLKIGLEDLRPTGLQEYALTDDIAECNKIFSIGGVTPSYCTPTGGAMLARIEPVGKTSTVLSMEETLDAWKNRITYAVSARLTTNAALSFDVSYGAITVQTEAAASLTDPTGSAMWVLVSHGEDGNGAYNSSGVQSTACGTASADIENCDNDSTFVNGIFSSVPGAAFFDDITYYSVMRISSLWTNASTNSTNGSSETLDLTNRNIGGAGVGLPAGNIPTERLQVQNTLKAANVMALKTCNGADCYEHGKFGSTTGRLCPTTPAVPANHIRVVTEIKNGVMVCTDVAMAATGVDQECASGKAMLGVNNLGFIICEP